MKTKIARLYPCSRLLGSACGINTNGELILLRLAEKVILLLFDEAAGTITRIPQLSRNFALGGSVLLELVIEDRIYEEAEHLFVMNTEPLENELLDPLLNRIVQSEQAYDVAHWIRDAASHAEDTFKCASIRLVEHGIFTKQEHRSFGTRRASRYDIIDPTAAGEPKRRILNVLSGTDIPDLLDAVLISLTDACGILENFLSNRELRSTAERVYQIRKICMLDRTISRALANIEAELLGRLY